MALYPKISTDLEKAKRKFGNKTFEVLCITKRKHEAERIATAWHTRYKVRVTNSLPRNALHYKNLGYKYTVWRER